MREFPANTSECAVVYKWWSSNPDPRVVNHIQAPIITSIATLRAVEPDVSVYVANFVDGLYDWGDFPSRLRFSVLPMSPVLEASIPKKDLWSLSDGGLYTGRGPLETASRKIEHSLDSLNVGSCSWPFDLMSLASLLPERYLVSCSSDVFWLRPILPLIGDADRLNVHKNNSGLFYFDKESDVARCWIELWQAYLSLAIRDFVFRRRLIEKYPRPAVIDEGKVFFYLRDAFPDIFDSHIRCIESSEILLPSDHCVDGFEKEFIAGLKGLNLGCSIGPYKGRFPMLFREMFDSIRDSFTMDELFSMYGMDIFNNSSFSLDDLAEPRTNPFYGHLSDKMNAKIRSI